MRSCFALLVLFVLGAAAWPVPEPPVRPAEPARAGIEPVSAAPPPPTSPGGAEEELRSPDPATPQPPPEPQPPVDPPPPPEAPDHTASYGEILGCVEDEDGCAVASFRFSVRRLGCGRRSRPAGYCEAGPGGSFRFQVRSLAFHLSPVPPDQESGHSLFTVWADGFAPTTYALDEEAEIALRRGERLTGVRIVMPRAVLVQGRVFGPDGHPAPAAWVTVSIRENDRETSIRSRRVDASGWFRFDTLRPRADMRVQAQLTDAKRRSVSDRVSLGDEIAGGDLLHVDLRLGPWRPSK